MFAVDRYFRRVLIFRLNETVEKKLDGFERFAVPADDAPAFFGVDLQNLIAATDFGTLFLDTSLRIKRFTDRVSELFSVTQTAEGRPITDFAHQLQYDDLVKDARAVLECGMAIAP